MGKKKCPFCAEKIQAKAIKCRFCGTSLDSKTLKQKKPKKRLSVGRFLLGILMIAFLCVVGLAIIGYIADDLNWEPSQSTSTKAEQSRETVPPRRQGGEVRTEKVVAKEETPSQKKVKSLKEFYIRIAFFNDTDIKPLSQNCRMWIRGFGDFYPARQRGWKFGGSLIEKAGPFDVNKKHTIYFYPDYSDEGREIKIPFKYSAGMNPEGSVRDMLSISVETDTIIFEGIPIKNANGQLTCEFNR